MCSILNALEERRKENEKKRAAASQGLSQLEKKSMKQEAWENAWNDFWVSESPGLLLYACLHGTVDIVKYFVTKEVPPTTTLLEIGCYSTPLELAVC